MPQVKAGNSRAFNEPPRRDHSASVNRSFPDASLVNVTGSQVRLLRPGSPSRTGNPEAVRVPWTPRPTPVFLSIRRMVGSPSHDTSKTPPEIAKPLVAVVTPAMLHGLVKGVPGRRVVAPSLKRTISFVVTEPAVTLLPT